MDQQGKPPAARKAARKDGEGNGQKVVPKDGQHEGRQLARKDRDGGGQRQIALLRGVNVGRAKRIAMADLRQVLGELGFTGARTLLNSGNAVFDCDGLDAAQSSTSMSATRIEEALVLKLGVGSRVTVLDAQQLDDVVADNPLGAIAVDPARLMVSVFSNPADRAKLEPLAHQPWEPEAFALGRWAAYIWCADGVLASRAAAAMGKLLGDGVTTRNWATISKLHALARADA
ncbi:uncharacterized protein (DUF1697 family) [Pseudoduganella lurida]|uniref:Uncharacterized protein (DUF1697 family) n=2 Tax=Pseudoduganella lurida TaxID=1036180 RepID=A0A562R574_9BURK|nr:uncharacterized protein (DUF1697 family) [Pseudoduganella lurida]